MVVVATTATAAENTSKDNYFVNSYKGIQEENKAEMVTVPADNNMVINEVTKEDLERLEGEGATNVNPKDIENMPQEEKQRWIEAMKEELKSLEAREVYDEMTNFQRSEKYW